jgi:hypothetical protein
LRDGTRWGMSSLQAKGGQLLQMHAPCPYKGVAPSNTLVPVLTRGIESEGLCDRESPHLTGEVP